MKTGTTQWQQEETRMEVTEPNDSVRGKAEIRKTRAVIDIYLVTRWRINQRREGAWENWLKVRVRLLLARTIVDSATRPL
mmetsp:Transcript_8196/g.20152  ORF Transcript_8196/g.20152 Transcript_8196/m.20152 type:complete len:80 (-) Transcript_8196:3-242(-)